MFKYVALFVICVWILSCATMTIGLNKELSNNEIEALVERWYKESTFSVIWNVVEYMGTVVIARWNYGTYEVDGELIKGYPIAITIFYRRSDDGEDYRSQDNFFIIYEENGKVKIKQCVDLYENTLRGRKET